MKKVGLWGRMYLPQMVEVLRIVEHIDPAIIYSGIYHPIIPLIQEGYKVVVADGDILRYAYHKSHSEEYAGRVHYICSYDPFHRNRVGYRVAHTGLAEMQDEYLENRITEIDLAPNSRWLPEDEIPIAGDLVPSTGSYESLLGITHLIATAPISTPLDMELIYI